MGGRPLRIAKRMLRKEPGDRLRALPPGKHLSRDILESLNVIVWEADATTWQFTFVSQGAKTILGYPVKQWLSEPNFWANHIHPDDREEAIAFCRTATVEGRDHEFEYRAVAADGRVIWLRDIVRVLKDNQGRSRRLRGVMMDITKRKEAEKRQALLHEINMAMTSSLDLSTVLELFLDKLKIIIPYATASIRLWNRETGELVPIAAQNLDPTEWSAYLRRTGGGLSKRLLEHRLPFLIVRISADAQVRDEEIFRKYGIVAYLGIPLIAKGHTVGVLAFGVQNERRFSDEEIDVFKTLAGYAAMAVYNSQLHHQITSQASALRKSNEELRDRTRQQAVIAHLSHLALAQTDIPALMDETVMLVSQTLGVEYAKVLELLPGGKALLLRAGVGWKEGYVGRATVGSGADSQAGYTLLSRGPVIVEELRTETRFSGPPLLRDHGVASGISVVIQGKERPFGVLGAHTTKRRAFAEDDIQFLQSVANVLATAIERRRAEAETQQHLKQVAVLREIAESVTSTLDLPTLLNLLLEKVESFLPPNSAITVRLLNKATGLFEATACRNIDEKAWKDRSVTAGRGLLKILLLDKTPVVAENVQTDPRTANHDFTREQGLVSYLGVPLAAKGEFLGVISFYSRAKHEFKQEEVELLKAVAGHAAIAIQNSQLYERTELNLKRMRALHEIETAITSTLDLRTVLDILVEKTHSLIPYSSGFIRLWNSETGVLEPTVCWDLDENEWKAVTWAKGGLSRIVLESKAPLIVKNIQKDPRTLNPDFASKHGLISYLGVPLIARGECLGVLAFHTKTEHDFSSEEVEFLSTLANQAAIAIQNSRLFGQVQMAGRQLQTLSRRLVETQESERRMIARELHDEIGQFLTALKLLLEMCRRLPPEAVKANLDEALELVNQLFARARNLSLDLRPGMLDDLGLLPTLIWHFDRYTTHTHVRVNFRHSGLERRFALEVETAAYRIVQEALTNIARHAGVSEVAVQIWADENTLGVYIRDDGTGFEPASVLGSGNGSGLSGMRERALLLGGELVVESAPGAGTILWAELPLENRHLGAGNKQQ